MLRQLYVSLQRRSLVLSGRIATGLLAALLAGLALSAKPAAAQTTPAGKPSLGLNVDLNEQAMVDMVGPLARLSSSAGGDANGWPRGDCQFVIDNRYTFAWVGGAVNIDPLQKSTDISGVYQLSFTGQANLSGYNATVTNQSYDAVHNTTSASVTIPNPAGGVLVLLNFSQTKRLPADGAGDGVTNIHLIRPGAHSDPNFTDLWLNSIKDYSWSALRFMGALGTNSYAVPSSPEVYPYRLQWATDRAMPAFGPLYQSHVGVHGIPWEYVILIANATRKDVWINIPVNASDDYVNQLAALLKNGDAFTNNQGIASGINIYVEYSNEMWHYGFPQGAWNYQAGIDEVAAGGSNLNYDAINNSDTWRYRRMAKRTIEIGQQFRAVFTANPGRIRPVVNNAFTSNDQDMLDYVTKNYGPPSQFLYGISQTGYYSSADTSSVAAILAGEKAASDSNVAGYLYSRTLATYYGLHSLAYEGGQGETGNGQPVSPVDLGLPNQFAAARDSGMADVETHDLLGNWYPSGGELYMQFSQVGRYSTYGFWGLSDDLTNQASGKWLGMVATMSAPAPQVTAGWAVQPTGSVAFPAGSVNGSASNAPSGTRVNTGATYNYLLNVAQAGTYTVSLALHTSSGTGVGEFLVDNASLATVTLPAESDTPVTYAVMTIPLTAGLHTLCVHGVKGCFDPTDGTFGDQWQFDSVTVTTDSTAAAVSGLFGTGLDANGNALSAGSADPHYAIVSTPSGASNAQAVVTDASWPLQSTASQSVGPVAQGNVAPGDYAYQTTFTVSGSLASLRLTGRMAADDGVRAVFLDGVKVRNATAGEYFAWTPLTISSGFVNGVNTLTFIVHNNGSKPNPSGLRVEIGTSAVSPSFAR